MTPYRNIVDFVKEALPRIVSARLKNISEFRKTLEGGHARTILEENWVCELYSAI